MKTMKTKITQIILCCCFSAVHFIGIGQQDEQNSMYMFNPLHFNPAYCGARGNLQAVGVFRAQWIGFEGAPQTQFLSVHSPISNKNMALGLNLSNDKIGARNRTSFYGNYAYTIRFKNGNRKLNLGLSAGGDMMAVDYAKLKAKDPNETDYLSTFAKTTFNVGAGLYYHSDKFYLGFSLPRVLDTKLKNSGIELSNAYTKRHFFLSSGYVFKLNSITDLKTSALVKMTVNAPLTVDLNASVYFYKTWWLGAMYRFNESVGFNFMYQLKESIMFGYAFDFPINGLSTVSKLGTHELMISFDLTNKQTFGSPRYF